MTNPVVVRIFLLLAASLGLAGCGGDRNGAEVVIDRYREVADFRFTNQQSEPFDRSQLAGKVWVADFIFTSCAAECIVLAQKMALLQDRFSDRDDVAFVSFSVDPQTDKPERLADYAKQWSADPERWTFLTGKPSELDFLIKQNFLLPMARNSREKTKLMTSNLVHTSKYAIVDREGVVRAYVEGLEPNAVEKVAGVVEKLLVESPEAGGEKAEID